MKQFIKYYYNLNVQDIEKDNLAYKFTYNNDLYYLIIFERDIKELNEILEIISELDKLGIDCHKIVFNRFNNAISVYNNFNYIMLRIGSEYQKIIDVFDIIELSNRLILSKEYKNKYNNNWKDLWQNKIDYYETQIRTYAKNNKGILNTFSYYVGMTENAIQYLNRIYQTFKIDEFDKITLCHRRIFSPNYKLNYLNPASFIIDLEVRDYAEYFKSEFFANVDIRQEFSSFLKIKKFGTYSYHMLFARLLFPSYYFDAYEESLQTEDSTKLIEIISNINKYEKFLQFAFNEISNYTPMISITWINDNKL